MSTSNPLKHYRHALVIGKFYPPHKGHMHLIETALERADRVSVLVYGGTYQHIKLTDRADWIRQSIHNARAQIVPVITDLYEDYDDQNVWDAHDAILQSALRTAVRGGKGIDVIVSSEDYGRQMAEDYFDGIDAIVVDQQRKDVPISGTKARNDLFGNWGFLPEPVRLGLIPRVIVVGAESTGTTTLSQDLADHYKARWVPEYGRQYTEEWLAAMKAADPEATMDSLYWRAEDFERIGMKQNVLENNAARQIAGYPLIVGDTDAFATALWETRYQFADPTQSGLGNAPWMEFLNRAYASTALPRRDLYLVTDHVGVPFEPDDVRDGEGFRPIMTDWFEDALTGTGKSWMLMRGSREDRLKMAVKMTDQLLAERLDFT